MSDTAYGQAAIDALTKETYSGISKDKKSCRKCNGNCSCTKKDISKPKPFSKLRRMLKKSND